MRPHRFYLVAILLIANTAYARVGGSDGGGGAAIVCPQPDGGIKAELVDLVESAFYEKYSLSATLQKLPWEKQVEIVVTRLGITEPEFNYYFRRYMQETFEETPKAIEKTKGTKIVFPAPKDLGSGRLPPVPWGCQVVGAASYSDEDEQLVISDWIWRALPPIHKAALVVHEGSYKLQRDYYRAYGPTVPTTSKNVRQFVGLGFSQELEDHYTQDVIAAARAKLRGKEAFCVKAYEPARPYNKLPEGILNTIAPLMGFVIRGSHHMCYLYDQVPTDTFVAGANYGTKDYCRVEVENFPGVVFDHSPKKAEYDFKDREGTWGAAVFNPPIPNFRNFGFSLKLICKEGPNVGIYGRISYDEIQIFQRVVKGEVVDKFNYLKTPFEIHDKREYRDEFEQDFKFKIEK